MKKLLFLLPIIGCGPYFVDFSAGIGANQKIEKTLKVDQKQSKAQTEANASAWEDIVNVLPIFFATTPVPTPTPAVPVIKSITLNLAETPKPTSTPKPVKRVVRKTLTAPKPSPTPCHDYFEGGYGGTSRYGATYNALPGSPWPSPTATYPFHD